MERMACVDVAAFPLQLLLRDHPDWKDHPAAVVDQDKAQGTILWVNSRARSLRILPGMRHGAGLALSRHLRAGVISHAVIEKAVDALVPRLRRFAAEVEPSRDEPGVFWLGASGLSLLHPRLEEWAGLIHGDLVDADLHNTVAVGFSRFGSYAAAKACDRIVVFHTPEEEHDHVRGVVLERLDFAPKVRDLLARLGIHTLGGFLDLPASQVRARLGKEAHRLHRLATGDLWSPLHPEIPPEPTTAAILLDYPEADRQRLAVLMEELLEPLLDSLDQRHEVMTSLLLHLRLDDKSQRSETLRPARPTMDRAQILDLLRLRMEATALTAGVTEIVMEVRGASPDIRQGELFHGASTRDHDAANRALARLRARFGDGALLRARPRSRTSSRSALHLGAHGSRSAAKAAQGPAAPAGAAFLPEACPALVHGGAGGRFRAQGPRTSVQGPSGRRSPSRRHLSHPGERRPLHHLGRMVGLRRRGAPRVPLRPHR